MKRSEVIQLSRLEKLEKLKKLGTDPYPAEVQRTHICAEALKEKNRQVTVVGRIIAIRYHGGAIFADLEDESGKIQILLKKDLIDETTFQQFQELYDTGDFIQVTGVIFITKAGETTIQIDKFKLLTKTLRNLPEKWYGFKNVEERYRKRYLDLLINKDVRRVFEIRGKIIKSMRGFLEDNGFMEIDTPMLQSIPGGASAKPFVTHYNAYNTDVYLRIAPELYHKRLIVGGFEKIYEFAKCFRNEGVDWSHNPEFTNLEFYCAYMDYEELMKFTEKMIVTVVKEVLGSDEINCNGKKIKIKAPFERKTFAEIAGKKTNDKVFKEGVKKIIEPTFAVNHPVSLLPLAKKKDDKTVQSFQLIIGGLELVKAFSELNDPVDQRKRFEEQMKLRAKGDEEAQRMDEDFIEALEYGMPPTAGWGMGIDRFVTLLTGQHALREVILFPFMKPRSGDSNR